MASKKLAIDEYREESEEEADRGAGRIAKFFNKYFLLKYGETHVDFTNLP